MVRKLLGAFVLMFGFGITAYAEPSPAEATYMKHCKSCHGEDGKGVAAKAKILKLDPEKLNLGRDDVVSLSVDKIKDVILNGKDKMPAYGKKLQADEAGPLAQYALDLAKAAKGK